MKNNYRMTADDLRAIKELGGTMPDSVLGKKLGYAPNTIAYYRKHLGIKPFSHNYRLSPEQEAFVKLHYRVDMRGTEIAKQFGILPSTFFYYIQKLGLENDKSRNKKSKNTIKYRKY